MSTALAALVTGGGSGMGREIALRLADDQPTLIIGRNAASLKETEKLAAGKKFPLFSIEGDIAAPDIGARIQKALADRGWEVSTLVLNAATWKSAPIEKLSRDEIAEMFGVNVLASFELVKLVVPGMKARQAGKIIFNSGIVGVKGFANDSAYCATKFAQVGMMKALGAELAKQKIEIVSLVSGFVEGARTDSAIEGLAKRRNITTAEARAMIEAGHPLKRIIPAQEIAALVAEIASGAPRAANPMVLTSN
jgi:3-oxoacyl-[acyl-carrier protein] reductase